MAVSCIYTCTLFAGKRENSAAADIPLETNECYSTNMPIKVNECYVTTAAMNVPLKVNESYSTNVLMKDNEYYGTSAFDCSYAEIKEPKELTSQDYDYI